MYMDDLEHILALSGGQFIMTALESLFTLRFPWLFLLQTFSQLNKFKPFPSFSFQ